MQIIPNHDAGTANAWALPPPASAVRLGHACMPARMQPPQCACACTPHAAHTGPYHDLPWEVGPQAGVHAAVHPCSACGAPEQVAPLHAFVVSPHAADMVALLEDIHFVALSAQLTGCHEPSGPSPNDSLCVARSVPEDHQSPLVCAQAPRSHAVAHRPRHEALTDLPPQQHTRTTFLCTGARIGRALCACTGRIVQSAVGEQIACRGVPEWRT